MRKNVLSISVASIIILGGFLTSNSCEASLGERLKQKHLENAKKVEQIEKGEIPENLKEKFSTHESLEKGEIPEKLRGKITTSEQANITNLYIFAEIISTLINEFGADRGKLIIIGDVLKAAGISNEVINAHANKKVTSEMFKDRSETQLESAFNNIINQIKVSTAFPSSIKITDGIGLSIAMTSLPDYIEASQGALENVLNFIYRLGIAGFATNDKNQDVTDEEVVDFYSLILNGKLKDLNLDEDLVYTHPEGGNYFSPRSQKFIKIKK